MLPTGGGERPVFVYEVSSSEASGSVTYRESSSGEPIGVTAEMTEPYWAVAPELDPATTTPVVSFSPSAGASASCRILRIDGSAVTVLDEQTSEDGATVECASRQPEHNESDE